jgi:hypothetical protein
MAYGKRLGAGNFAPGFRLHSGDELTNAFIKLLEGGLSRRDSITAFAGGGKASATALSRSVNRITTCATAGDSVLLPKAIAGSLLILINQGAQAAAFYGNGNDTVDGLAAASASYVAKGDSVWLACVTAGVWQTVSTRGVIKTPQTLAATGATQGNAAQITAQLVFVTITASTEGVKLPSAVPGMEVTVCADTAKGVKVYPATNAKIGSAATNVAVALAANKTAKYYAFSTTQWRVMTGA